MRKKQNKTKKTKKTAEDRKVRPVGGKVDMGKFGGPDDSTSERILYVLKTVYYSISLVQNCSCGQ